MLKLRIALIRLKDNAKRIKRKSRMLRRPALISTATLTLTVIMVMLMTGVLYFKNDIMITDGEAVKNAFTMKDDPDEILNEFGYSIGEFDRVIFSGISNGVGVIDIIRGFGVTVNADGQTFTAGAIEGETPETVLTNSSITVNPYDVIEADDDGITLIRGFGVDVTADGQTVTIGTTGSVTVGDILNIAGVELGRDDLINLPYESEVFEGDEIIIRRVTFRERIDTEETPYETAVHFSNLTAIGSSEVIEGVKGEVTVTYGEKLIDGVVVTSEVLSKETVKEPKTEHITYGNALNTPYSKREFAEITLENGLPVDYLQVITGTATAYTAPSTASTASGRTLQVGTVAVDPKVIPYGSLLYITSADGKHVYGAAIAADTGDFPAFGVLVDLFMGTTTAESYSAACEWGARQVNIYVINQGVY